MVNNGKIKNTDQAVSSKYYEADYWKELEKRRDKLDEKECKGRK